MAGEYRGGEAFTPSVMEGKRKPRTAEQKNAESGACLSEKIWGQIRGQTHEDAPKRAKNSTKKGKNLRFYPFLWWEEVDLNHRSRRRQIYRKLFMQICVRFTESYSCKYASDLQKNCIK